MSDISNLFDFASIISVSLNCCCNCGVGTNFVGMVVIDCALTIAMYDCFCWVNDQVTIVVEVIGLLDVVVSVSVFLLLKISLQKYACLGVGEKRSTHPMIEGEQAARVCGTYTTIKED